MHKNQYRAPDGYQYVDVYGNLEARQMMWMTNPPLLLDGSRLRRNNFRRLAQALLTVQFNKQDKNDDSTTNHQFQMLIHPEKNGKETLDTNLRRIDECATEISLSLFCARAILAFSLANSVPVELFRRRTHSVGEEDDSTQEELSNSESEDGLEVDDAESDNQEEASDHEGRSSVILLDEASGSQSLFVPLESSSAHALRISCLFPKHYSKSKSSCLDYEQGPDFK
ncbi:hypothetical protein EVAR_40074_1 [Eumeta japonica]|uniref:Uncharacterized protein n=1 Tax=Eumeta variegata TaxID=151549 RepID=A0A4C1X1D2_EUMVA|nr:hypothetical protein EVAR_40074_1 [Eumeta japonica]